MGVKVSGLSYSYKDFSVEKISFEAKKGSMTTILGPNGSGKTTILKTIFGLLKSKEGSIYIDGRGLCSLTQKEKAKLMGYVPQTHNPSFPYSVIEVVAMGFAPLLSPLDLPSKEHYHKAFETLKLLGIESLKDKPYTSLSGGQLQLVLIARALVRKPDILLFDEPIAHLDFKNQIIVLNLIKKLTQKEKICAIITLHDPNLTLLYADKVVLVSRGKLVKYGKPKNVITKNTINEVFQLNVEVVNVENRTFVIPIIDW